MAIGSGEEVPNWLLGVGLWFGAAGFCYAIWWQASRDVETEREPA